MGDGTKENPFASADVYMRIAENGNVTEGLDLSGNYFEEGIDLHEIDLTGAILNGAVLNRAVLKGAGLDKCHLRGAHLRRANLKGTQLRGVHLEGADLWRANLEGADLRGAHLEGANSIYAHLEGANLRGAHLEGADLMRAHLESANLVDAHLEKANLQEAHLEGAELWLAHLECADLAFAYLEATDLWFANLAGVRLWGARINDDTKLLETHWGNYILEDENKLEFGPAADTYRQLKMWYTKAGIYNTAGEFFFREMTVKRKMLQWWPNPFPRAWSKLISLICGYGERPLRVVTSAAVAVFGLALIYFAVGTLTPNTFLNSLYYSAVSFTALGYGSWAPQPTGWVKGLGAVEAFVGVFMMALFLITFVKKMTR